MNDKKRLIIIGFAFVIICFTCILLYQRNKYNKIMDGNIWKSSDYVERENRCSFTKTYHVVNLLDGYVADVQEWSYVILDQFQNHNVIAHKIPTKIKEKMEVDKYYEFKYIIVGTGNIDDIEDINKHIVLDDVLLDSYIYEGKEARVILSVVETQKEGLEQIQQNICKGITNNKTISGMITSDKTRYDEYLQRDEGRMIYLEDGLKEFYINDNGQKKTLKEYAKTFQGLDDIIKYITAGFEEVDSLNDGGTKIYKSKIKDTTIVVCNTTSGNKDIFIGKYNMVFDKNSMCTREVN